MKRKLINIRMTEKEKMDLEKRAKDKGMSLSAYLRYISKLKVVSTLADNKKITVNTQ